MQLCELTLHNIRSYKDQTVSFEDGLTLLSGDIGCGKSTILLAIEFALFGIRRGDISGEGLLRHGSNSGSVTLTFNCLHKITIHRQLKRTKAGVRQEPGFLEINGTKEALTPQELKARILEILGYPAEQLTKSKGFVFRYTVYTPQETMKHILQEADSIRLDTLRTIFGVDKYKIIAENTSLVAKKLREDKREIQGFVADLVNLELEADELQKRAIKAAQEFTRAQSAQEKEQVLLEITQKEFSQYEEQFKQEQKRKRELASLTTKQESLAKQEQTIMQDVARLKKHEKPFEKENQQEKIIHAREKRDTTMEKYAKIQGKIAQIEAEKKQAKQRANKITELADCPICEQEVSQNHKQHVASSLKETIKRLDARLQKANALKQTAQKHIELLDDQEKRLQTFQKEYQHYLAKKEQFTQAQKQQELLEKRLEKCRKDAEETEKQFTTIQVSSFDEKAYLQKREDVHKQQQVLQEVSIASATAKTTLAEITKQQERLTKRIKEKQERKKRLAMLEKTEQWISSTLVPVTGIIEKHVLQRIHQEFSSKFTEWFLQLIEDESFFVQLSESFTPLITQNGYDIDASHLSGGEKTSVALAYRLALTTVLMSMMQSLNTNGLLILDEPTDGFSAQQLDRVRDVLAQLSCKQIILVSHEQKMESFVDHVIRVEKHEHISQITT